MKTLFDECFESFPSFPTPIPRTEPTTKPTEKSSGWKTWALIFRDIRNCSFDYRSHYWFSYTSAARKRVPPVLHSTQVSILQVLRTVCFI